MSPKFYWFLWVLFAVSVAIVWLANVLTMLAIVVFGFIAFGLIFAGMMCVLPGTVSHTSGKPAKLRSPRIEPEPAVRPIDVHVRAGHGHFPVALRFH